MDMNKEMNKEMDKIDIVIPVYWDSIACAEWNIPRLYEEFEPQKIVVIGPAGIEKELPKREYIEFVEEDSLVPGLCKDAVSSCLDTILSGSSRRAGWYYQQFLKLGYALTCKDEYYLIFDMDTTTKGVSFFDSNGKPKFYTSSENHQEYMDTLSKLIPGVITKYDSKISFIVNYMLFKTEYVCELLDIIGKSDIRGNCWWEKILNSIDVSCIKEAGFSEFETYGNYVMKYHPEVYSIDNARQYRTIDTFISMTPTREQLEWVFKSFESITFEDWNKINYIHVCKLLMKLGLPVTFATTIHDFISYIIVQSRYHLAKVSKRINGMFSSHS
ncbi:MAG: hypothetical protein IJR29_09090 [Butyrivibrio sp.]|nr:hypothetical protein [Butyrivibrio sp.]